MNRLRRFYSAAIGKKIVMGVTGLIGIGFLILHMAGNLLAFRGPDAINAYAHFLASTGEALWLPPLPAHSIENIGNTDLWLIAVELK